MPYGVQLLLYVHVCGVIHKIWTTYQWLQPRRKMMSASAGSHWWYLSARMGASQAHFQFFWTVDYARLFTCGFRGNWILDSCLCGKHFTSHLFCTSNLFLRSWAMETLVREANGFSCFSHTSVGQNLRVPEDHLLWQPTASEMAPAVIF